MPPDTVVTLATDFGEASPYAAALKGSILQVNPAARLVDQGYEVVGATMKLFCYGDSVPDRPCCSLDSINDARAVADALRIPHYVLNLEDRFALHVIENFVAEYSRGRFVYDLERLSSQTHPVSTLWDPSDSKGE